MRSHHFLNLITTSIDNSLNMCYLFFYHTNSVYPAVKFYVLISSINLQNNILRACCNKWEFAINFKVAKFHCYVNNFRDGRNTEYQCLIINNYEAIHPGLRMVGAVPLEFCSLIILSLVCIYTRVCVFDGSLLYRLVSYPMILQ